MLQIRNIEEPNRYMEEHGKDLYKANLSYADLSCADLVGANLDYSCWPLWCGSLKAQIDDRIAVQLLYHLCSTVKYSPDVSKEIKDFLLSEKGIELANRFHRVNECGEL